MKLLIILLSLMLTSCAAIDNILSPPTGRTDLVTVRLTVAQVSPERVQAECKGHARVLACTSDMIYIQGDGLTVTKRIHVQFMSYADIGDKCGRFTAPACMDGNTLYTYPYTTIDPYIIGTIGDLVAEYMGLDIGLNRRTQLGHEVMVHALGVGEDPHLGAGTPHLLAAF